MSQEAFVAPRIGGGIGNRLFEFAAAAGAAEKWGRRLCFATEYVEPNTHGSPTTIFKMFPQVPVVDIPAEEMDSVEYGNEEVYTFRPFPERPPSDRTIVMKGFFQSPLYFPKGGVWPNWGHAINVTRLAAIECESGLTNDAERRRTWFIHFRFGDYKDNMFHYWPLDRYYKKCLMSVPSGARLHVFSDEPELCHDWLLGTLEEIGAKVEVTWSKTVVDVEGLYEMSLCWGGAICANSTYSWWGAYFAHMRGGNAHRAYYPDGWGLGVPPPSDLVPSWGEKVATEWSPVCPEN